MKFLKLNKLNEDFFDDVEIDNDDEVNDDNEQYELIIKLKPICGSREVKCFVNMIPFDNIYAMFSAVCSNLSFCVVSEISFTFECDNYKKTFSSVHNSPSISEIVTQYIDVLMYRNKYPSVSNVKPLFTYSVKFSVPNKLKNLKTYRRDITNFSKWYSSSSNYYSSITTDRSCCMECLLKYNDDIIYEKENWNILYLFNELGKIIVDEYKDSTKQELDDYIYKKVVNVVNIWKKRFYNLENVAKKDGIGGIKLINTNFSKDCATFFYDVSKTKHRIKTNDICDFIYNNTVGKFSLYDKIRITWNGKMLQTKVIIFLIYDENVENDKNPIFERKDTFTQSCEITTTINITNFQQAEKIMKLKNLLSCVKHYNNV